MLGGAAGVMLAATSFSLIVPGIECGDLVWPGYCVYIVVSGKLWCHDRICNHDGTGQSIGIISHKFYLKTKINLA
jgi:hypothetical protein